jgi:hypothetical protein
MPKKCVQIVTIIGADNWKTKRPHCMTWLLSLPVKWNGPNQSLVGGSIAIATYDELEVEHRIILVGGSFKKQGCDWLILTAAFSC